jgi:hypothetical protein
MLTRLEWLAERNLSDYPFSTDLTDSHDLRGEMRERRDAISPLSPIQELLRDIFLSPLYATLDSEIDR